MVLARRVPVIDIGPFRDGSDPGSVVAAVDAACRELGFLVVTGHGVPDEVLRGAVGGMRSFFALPAERKAAHATPGSSRSGYSEFANMSLAQSLGGEAPADLREGFSVARSELLDPAAPIWAGDGETSPVRRALLDHYAAMEGVADTLMQVFAVAWGLPRDHFEQFTAGHDSNLGVFHYPPMGRPPLPGQLRGGPHTDFGSLTLLHADPSVEGLQVWDGEGWEDVPVVPGAFVVNLGDLMQRWTDDGWSSTLHRVANPTDGAWDADRISLAFFHQPRYDALIASLDPDGPGRYEPITSGEHFFRKIEAMRTTAADESAPAGG